MLVDPAGTVIIRYEYKQKEINVELGLQERLAVVTGGSSGMGKAIALGL